MIRLIGVIQIVYGESANLREHRKLINGWNVTLHKDEKKLKESNKKKSTDFPQP